MCLLDSSRGVDGMRDFLKEGVTMSEVKTIFSCNQAEIIDNHSIWLPVVVGWCNKGIDSELGLLAKEELFIQAFKGSDGEPFSMDPNSLAGTINVVLEGMKEQRKRLLCKRELYQSIGKKLKEFAQKG